MYMKILVSEEQLNNLLEKIKPTSESQEVGERSRSFAFTRKKRLFSKAELMANPDRYRKYDRDLKEIDVYKFSEPRHSDKPRPEEYEDVLSSSTHVGDVGPYSYFYVIGEEESVPTVRFFVLDQKRQEYVGIAEFEMRYGGEFFVALPFIRKEFRGQGIAMQIYKLILTMGNIVSGKAQSRQAVGLWRKLFRELPNKMVYVDDDGKEFDVYEKDNVLHTTKTNTSVYDVKGGYLKMYK